MKQTKYLFILFLFSTFYSKSQSSYILAGQHDANDYYYKFIPDSNVISIPTEQTRSYYSLDINHDGIMDFKFSLLSPTSSLAVGGQYCSITPLSINNSVSLLYYDTCIGYPYGVVYHFNYNDTISSNANWDSSEVYLDYLFYAANYGSCQFYNTSSAPYIGVRIKVDTVYEYGWIIIAGEHYDAYDTTTLTMGTFACQNYITGIKSYSNDKMIKVFPNPASDRIIVESNNVKIKQIDIYDIFGKKILNTNAKNIALSNLNEGVYFIHVITSEESFIRKIIIQR